MSTPSPQTQLNDFAYAYSTTEEASDLESSEATEPEASSHQSSSETTTTEVSSQSIFVEDDLRELVGDLTKQVRELTMQVRDLATQVRDLTMQVRDLRLIEEQNIRNIEALQAKKGVKAKIVKLLRKLLRDDDS